MVTLYDHLNRPIKRDVLKSLQTSRTGSTVQRWATHPSRGLTPSRLASILQSAEQGNITGQLDLFSDMEQKDTHIQAEMGKRRRALMGLDWSVVAPRNASSAEKKAAELVNEMLQDVKLTDIIFELGDAIGKGFSCMELEWELYGEREWFPKGIHHRPARRFTIPNPHTEEIRLRDDSPEGEALQPFGWIVHTHKAISGYLSEASLYRVLAWPYLFKVYSVRDLAEFIEIYGPPFRLGMYGNGASEEEKATLLDAVVNLGHDSAAIIPESMKVEFKEASRGGSDPFTTMIEWCERSESKAILGATLTSQADATSNTNALGNVHNEVRGEIKISDANQIAESLTRYLVYPIAALNAGITDPRRAPLFRFDTSDEGDLQQYAENLPKLVGMGLRIGRRWAHERLKIPEAQEGEEILQVSPVVPQDVQTRETKAKAKLGELPAAEVDSIDNLVEQLGNETEPVHAAMLGQIEKLVSECRSMQELAERVEELCQTMPVDELADAIGKAMFLAHLAGRFDVMEGS